MTTENNNLFIADGVVSTFANAIGVDNADDAADQLIARVEELVELYRSNSMQTFWSAADLAAAHVIMTNHLLNKLDTDAIINDVETYEVVFNPLPDFFESWVTERKRANFNQSVDNAKQLAENHRHALVGALSVAIDMIKGGVDNVQVLTGDDQALLEIVKHTLSKEEKKGYALVRLNLVLSSLNGTPVPVAALNNALNNAPAPVQQQAIAPQPVQQVAPPQPVQQIAAPQPVPVQPVVVAQPVPVQQQPVQVQQQPQRVFVEPNQISLVNPIANQSQPASASARKSISLSDIIQRK